MSWHEQNCKPGSVFDSHLSRRIVAGTLKPPREQPGQPLCSHTGVAPDRVYSDGQFPAVGCALTAPFHPYWQTPASASHLPAVYLCCTFPEVAFGGRYPLSLPCGARTFLMDGLSACPRDCLFYSCLFIVQEGGGNVNGGKLARRVVISRRLRYNFNVCKIPAGRRSR